MTQEALKLALEALTYIYTETTADEDELIDQAITALKEALAQPEQEPMAWQWLGSAHFRKKLPKNADITAWNPLYTTPPQRTWVGLTKQQQLDIFAQSVAKKRSEYEHYMAIEQALKERNQ